MLTADETSETRKHVGTSMREAYQRGYQDGLTAAQQWQPIETAPKQQRVLVRYGVDDFYGVAVCYQQDHDGVCTPTWRYAEGPSRGLQAAWPTHWQPLPPPPTQEKRT